MSNDSSKPAAPAADQAPTVRPRQPWNPISAAAIGVLLFVLTQLLASIPFIVYPAFRHWSSSRAQTWVNGVYIQFIYILLAEALTVAGLAWFMRRRGMSFRRLGLNRFKAMHIAYALSGFGVYFVAYIALVTIASNTIHGLNVDQKQDIGFNSVVGPAQLLVTFISLVVLPPLVEETLFRGFLFTSFRRRFKLPASIVLVSLLFAAPHLLESQAGAGPLWIGGIDTFMLSVVLCYTREKTGSLWPGVGIHALKNGIAFVSLFLLHVK